MERNEERHVGGWKTVLAIFSGLIIPALFFILRSTDFDKIPTDLAIGWTLAIISITTTIAILIYGFVIKRIWIIKILIDKLETKLAFKDDIIIIGDRVEDAINMLEDTYKISAKELLLSAREFGLEMVYKSRAEVEHEISERLKNSSLQIKFLGISVSMTKSIPRAKEIISQKAENGVSCQFLFLDIDNNDFFSQRAIDEYYPTRPEGDLSGEAKLYKGVLLGLQDSLRSNEAKRNLEIAEYNAFPYLSLVIIDNTLFVGPYLFGQTCPNQPMYRIRKTDGGIFDVYFNHFEKLWNSAEKIS